MEKLAPSLIALFILVIVVTTSHAQKHANVSGKWSMSVETSVGNGSPDFELKHLTPTKLEGTYKGQLGEAPVTGTIAENKIHLQFEVSGNLVEYDGTVDGETMKGNVKWGSMGNGTFTAARKK
jgi:hypothetical protein